MKKTGEAQETRSGKLKAQAHAEASQLKRPMNTMTHREDAKPLKRPKHTLKRTDEAQEHHETHGRSSKHDAAR